MWNASVFWFGFLVTASSLAAASQPLPSPSRDVPWCSADELLERSLKSDPGLRKRMEAFDEMSRARRSLQPKDALLPIFVIPVVVHVIHSGAPVGVAENISDAQITSQLNALARDFGNSLHHPQAVDTGIRFCLVKNAPPGVSWPGMPGVTRKASALTDHNLDTQEALLKALDYFPADKYLNIWIVRSIAPVGVAGYARFPGTVPANLDGIVMRYDAFGSNLISPGGTWNLLPDNADGKILAHEVGHYLNLFHTFQGGCLEPGDHVADTAPEATAAFGCLIGRSTCGSLDPVQNFMDYTSDFCREQFSELQAERMRDAILIYRNSLVDPANLVVTGCAPPSLPSFNVSTRQACTGQPVTFSTVSSAAQYDWSFPGGSPAQASGVGPQTVVYNSPGIYDVSLTTNDASGKDPQSLTKTGLVFVSSCPPVASSQGNWYFGFKAGLRFASGQPVAALDSAMTSSEGCVTQSDAAGSLLFYSDSVNVYDHNHHLVNPGAPLKGKNSNTQGALSIPVPGNQHRYYLFTLGPNDSGGALLWSTIVDTTGSSIALVSPNQQVSLPKDVTLAEQMTAVPKCNGADYWLIVKGAAGTTYGDKILAYSVTAAGISGPTISSSALPSTYGSLKASPDGSMLAQCTVDNSLKQSAGIYDFDRTTGGITLRSKLMHGSYGCSFSPNSKLLYVSEYDSGNSLIPIYQYDATAVNPSGTASLVAQVPSGFAAALQLGPDQKIYISDRGPSGTGNSSLQVINFPNERNTALHPNACGYDVNGPSLGGKLSDVGLPNMIDALPGLVPADFEVTTTACSQVQFHTRNCGTSFAWSFGDGAASTLPDPAHTYASPGTYNVKLTVTSGGGTTSVTKPLKVGIAPVSITGPANACNTLSNYSVNAVSGVSYTWQISGGAPTTKTGVDVDVAWGSSGGKVTVTADDPATGCQTSATFNVGPCGGSCGGAQPVAAGVPIARSLDLCPTCKSTWEAACTSPGKTTAEVTLCNHVDVPQTYAWSLAGVAAQPGTVCSVDGPTSFVPDSGQVTVAPFACSTVPVTIACPAGQPVSAHGCFQVNAVDVKTGAGLACSGSTLVVNKWLWKPEHLFYDLPFRTNATIDFQVTNLGDAAGVLDYGFSVMSSDMKPAPPIVRLNGGEPGAPAHGSIRLGAGESGHVGVNVAFTEPRPLALFDLLVEADLDGSGTPVAIASAGLRSAPPDCNHNGVDDAQDIALGTSTDCNGNDTPDECEIAADPSRDCNGNRILDSCEVTSGATPDVNANGVPDSCEVYSVIWIFSGAAQGGQVSTTIQGHSASCTVTITTLPGQSAETVASNFAAALNASPCLAGQGITASASGRQVVVHGFDLFADHVSDQITDPGLLHQMPVLSIPTLSVWGLLLLMISFTVLGWRWIARRP